MYGGRLYSRAGGYNPGMIAFAIGPMELLLVLIAGIVAVAWLSKQRPNH
jgi:hypothetical protein